MLAAAAAGETALLIAPTGGGKTLAGFLPSLVELSATPRPGIHTLYVSPLKALGTDVARNLTAPIAEMKLPITVETRSGDTPQSRRARQKEASAKHPADHAGKPGAAAVSQVATRRTLFRDLRCVIVDEVHALAGTKRGDQLALCLARLTSLAPAARRTGLSATVAYKDAIERLCRLWRPGAPLVEVAEGEPPELEIRLSEDRVPWSGRMGLASAAVILDRIRAAGMTIVFVNTRAQGELLFQALWKLNEETLPIALHHGSLDIAQRRRVEAAMSRGDLRGGGGDVLAGPRHRLGRRGPGDPGGRAQGRLPPAAAGRAVQPPHGRGQPRHPGAGQPVRGAGMRGRGAGRRRARAGRRPAAARRAGRAGAAHPAVALPPRPSCRTTCSRR